MKNIASLICLALCYAIFLGYLGMTYGELPDRVASHFASDGQPNGWMTKGELLTFMVGIAVLMPAFVIGTMASTRWLPTELINLPNRVYWLAPERRLETSRMLTRFGVWFACLNVLFITGVHRLTVAANRGGAVPHLSGVGLTVVAGLFLLGTGIWCGVLMRMFRKIE